MSGSSFVDSIGQITEEAIELYEQFRKGMDHEEAKLAVKIELMSAAYKGWNPSERWTLAETVVADAAMISEACEPSRFWKAKEQRPC